MTFKRWYAIKTNQPTNQTNSFEMSYQVKIFIQLIYLYLLRLI